MANSKEQNDTMMHISQLRSYVNSCEARRNNTAELLNEKEVLTDALNKLKSEDINLIQERNNIVQEIMRQEERMIVLLQYQSKNESYKEANSKITEENVELKEKIKKLKESTAELIKENGQLTSEYLETKAKEAATLEQDMDSKLDGLTDLWRSTNDGYKVEIKQYETQVNTLRANISRLESVKKSFENRFTSKQMYNKRKFINDKNHVRSLAEYSANYVSKRGDEDMAKAILEATTYPLINENDVKSLAEDSAETISKQSDEDMVTDLPTNDKLEAATHPLINDTNDVKSLAENSAETVSKQSDEDMETDLPTNVQLEAATHPLISDTNDVKSLAEDSAETVSKQGDEDMVTDLPTNVQFERRAFLSDNVHTNILGKQNIETNTKCYREMKLVSASRVDPTNSSARTRVYVRKGSR